MTTDIFRLPAGAAHLSRSLDENWEPRRAMSNTDGAAAEAGDDDGKGGIGGGPSKPPTKPLPKGKKGKDVVARCSNCDRPGPVRRCTQCGVEAYCGEACQRVSARRV